MNIGSDEVGQQNAIEYINKSDINRKNYGIDGLRNRSKNLWKQQKQANGQIDDHQQSNAIHQN